MFCAIWYHLYNLKNVKNTHGGVLLLVKLQAFVELHSFRRVSGKSPETLGKLCLSTKSLQILPKVTLLHGCFSRYLDCASGTQSRKTSHIFKKVLLRVWYTDHDWKGLKYKKMNISRMEQDFSMK